MVQKGISQVLIGNPIYGGNFLTKLEGKTAFVPFVLPGELVKVLAVQEQKNYLFAEPVEISKASSDRIQPVCPYFQICGGCHYQHINAHTQAQIKEQIFSEQLIKIGKLKTPNIRPILTNGTMLGYRNHLQLTPNPAGKLSFVHQRPQMGLVPIEHCEIASQRISEVIRLLDFDPEHKITRVSIREGKDDLLVVLESNSPDVPEINVEGDFSVTHSSRGDNVVIAGSDHILMEVSGQLFKVSAGSFFQVNSAMAAEMVQLILREGDFQPDDVVFDLYSGVGLFSVFIAPLVKEIIAIEESPSAAADFVENLDRFNNLSLFEADVAEALPHIDQKADVVIIDPPRAGIEKTVLDRLVAVNPRSVIYVSCDPSTLARDLSRFSENGYELRFAQPVDMFPNTYHVESVSILDRRN